MAIIERAPRLTGDTKENPSAIKPSCSLALPAKPARWLTGVNRSLLLSKYLLPGPGRGEEKTVLNPPSQDVQTRENTKTLSVSRWWKVENHGLGSHSKRGDQFPTSTRVPGHTHARPLKIKVIKKSHNLLWTQEFYNKQSCHCLLPQRWEAWPGVFLASFLVPRSTKWRWESGWKVLEVGFALLTDRQKLAYG